jgi:hypothetical protein
MDKDGVVFFRVKAAAPYGIGFYYREEAEQRRMAERVSFEAI